MTRPVPPPAGATTRDHLVTGSVLLGAAAVAVPLVPGPLVALALVVIVLRLLWLEENISDDLSVVARRRIRPTGPNGPLARATAMRAEAQAWSVAAAGIGASLAWLGVDGPMGVALWAVAFGLGLRRVDRLVETLDLMAAGRALDAESLLQPVPAALSTPPRGRR